MSHTRDWSAGEIAAYDQEIAEVDLELGRLVRAFRIGAAEKGDPQAAANLMVYVRRDRSATDLAVLLVAALRRLAAADPDPDWPGHGDER